MFYPLTPTLPPNPRLTVFNRACPPTPLPADAPAHRRACPPTPLPADAHLEQLAFRSAQSLLALKKDHVRRILHLPTPPPADAAPSADAAPATTAAQELEQHVSAYLRRTVDSFDLTKSIDEVCSQIWATLYDYPSLKTCTGLLQYVRDSVRLAWALVNQTPTYVLEYEQRLFRRDVHVRFHSSSTDSEDIRTYLWPALLEGAGGPCVHKAVVLT